MGRQEIAERGGFVHAQNHVRIQIGWIHLPHELPTSSARWQHIELAIAFIAPHSHDSGDLVFTSRHHRGDGGVFGTEASTGSGIDANSAVELTGCGYERGGHIAEKSPIGSGVGVEKSGSKIN